MAGGSGPYLKGHLCQKDEFVPLEEAPGRVHVDGVGDLICQVAHALLDLVRRGRLLDGFLEHHVEGLGSGQGGPRRLTEPAVASAVVGRGQQGNVGWGS